MHRSLSGLMAGLLLVSLVACTRITPTPSPTTSTPRRTIMKQVAGSSMEPNFHDGQIVEIEEVPVTELRRGEVIYFTADGKRDYLKRLIGLPDETIEIRAGKVYINDKALDEPYVQRSDTMDVRAITLKSGEYYVLGDNRPNSSDSRAMGPISGVSILGRVKQ